MHAATDCITKYRGHQLLERRGGIAVPYPHYTAHERTSNGCERVLLHVFDTYVHLLIHICQVDLRAILRSSYILADDFLVWQRRYVLYHIVIPLLHVDNSP